MRWAGFGLAAFVRALRCAKARAFQPDVLARKRRTGTSPPARHAGTATEDSRQRLNSVVPAQAGTQCGV